MISAKEAIGILSRTRGSILGIDVGVNKFGVALSIAPWSETRLLPSICGRKQALRQLPEIAQSHGVRLLVLGWPLELSGIAGHRCDQVIEFTQELSVPAPTVLIDERLTTQAARQEINLRAPKRWRRATAKYEDGIAAKIILDIFLNKYIRTPSMQYHNCRCRR
mmetsp:Transcript_16811/g.25292  ORF Transcript_16811/g.25292 Transcript_16811/m.25292 type:complete len:164 (+) Transcript_16811:137-628(+)